MDDPDAELVQEAVDTGAPEALARLVDRHLIRIHRVVRGMTLDDSAADDLTQETFMLALRKIGQFSGKSRFSTWLTRIALNVALTHLRRVKSSPTQVPQEVAAASGSVAESAGRSRAPIDELIAREITADVTHALAALSPPLRAAIVLTAIDELPAIDAAEIENCPVGTMYWRIHEARKQLRQRLAIHLK